VPPTQLRLREVQNFELQHMSLQMNFLLRTVGLDFDKKLDAHISTILQKAWELGSVTYNIADAIKWADNFQFPSSIGARDWKELEESDSLVQLCEKRHSLVASSKLSVERVNKVVTDKRLESFNGQLDKNRLLEIAGSGMIIPTSSAFEPSSIPPKMRKKYLLVQSAVNKIIYGMYQKGGLLLILPTEKVKMIPGIHFSSTHWTTKKDKASGRVLGDQSNDPDGNALNDKEKEVQTAVKEMWGKIEHPTINDLVNLIVRVASQNGWHNILLWKMDLKGAFGLLRIRSQDIAKFAFELSDGLSLIHTAGMFGWTGTPFAFSVVSRILEGCINSEIHGGLCVYVDDLCGCSSVTHGDTDQSIAKQICTDLLGEDALAEDKHFQGRRLDMLGWSFDLDLRTVSISETNHLKTIYCMFSIDITKKQHIKIWQAIASRASRYVMVCEHMKPYTSAFHRMVSSFNGSTSIAKEISQDARMDLEMWKAFLCLLVPHENKFARQLESFQVQRATIKIEYDASLTGFGYVISEIQHDEQWKIISFLGLDFPFQQDTKNDSSFQNVCEFIAVVSALTCLWTLKYNHFNYILIGDNVSSLSWCQRGRSNSVLARRAMIAFSLISIQTQATLHSTIHTPGTSNTICDSLSRKEKRSSVTITTDLISPEPVVLNIMSILNTINPILCQNFQIGNEQVWTEILQFLQYGQKIQNH